VGERAERGYRANQRRQAEIIKLLRTMGGGRRKHLAGRKKERKKTAAGWEGVCGIPPLRLLSLVALIASPLHAVD
jgi:hypothetical protein